MTRKLWVVALGAVLACGGTEPDGDTSVIDGSGVIVKQARTVGAFHGVRIDSAGRLELSTAAEASVEVEADDNVVDRVHTELVDGILVVGLESGSYSDVTLVVRVAAPALGSVEITGAGRIEGTVGDVESLEVTIAGAGTVTLSGTAEQATIRLTGAGAFHGYDLLATDCTVRLTGAGLVEITASDTLDASVEGAGSIRYDGGPTVVRADVEGLGSILPR
jgi:hypothetical protein